jgi:hypothetical protein
MVVEPFIGAVKENYPQMRIAHPRVFEPVVF